MNKLNYKSKEVPDNYRCTVCGRHGCKMWRQYNTMADYIELLCVDCAMKDQKVLYAVDDNGYHKSEFGDRIDQIEWLIPAIPTDGIDTYWGYTSVPQNGVKWWRRLPLRAKNV
jgi:hypothetical protein